MEFSSIPWKRSSFSIHPTNWQQTPYYVKSEHRRTGVWDKERNVLHLQNLGWKNQFFKKEGILFLMVIKFICLFVSFFHKLLSCTLLRQVSKTCRIGFVLEWQYCHTVSQPSTYRSLEIIRIKGRLHSRLSEVTWLLSGAECSSVV